VKAATNPVPRLPRKDFVTAYEYMRSCRKEKFRLQSLCQFLGSSEERFSRLFLASTNSTPAAFYNRLLMLQAKGVLIDSNLSVKEIGFRFGFKTSSHFSSAFRREFGSSPQEFRRI
jgi:AraC family transcriptional regulator